MDSLATTPLWEWHRKHGARLVDFAGWSMPVQYSSISAEHEATRSAATLFDVSHMGRFKFVGEATATWLDRLLTRRVDNLRNGRVRYSLVTNVEGGTLDDVLVYRVQHAEEQTPEFWMVVNASNREKIWNWLLKHEAPSSAKMQDLTSDTAMIAVQGPRAREIVVEALRLDQLTSLSNYTAWYGVWAGETVLVSRTGYTGEDGFELIVPNNVAEKVWQTVLAHGAAINAMAAGLGARDTLRLEAAMPLYGHELSESITPIQAGLEFAVNLSDRSFPGRKALVEASTNCDLPQRVGLRLDGKRVARESSTVLDLNQTEIGEVTSGTFSPTLKCPIAMAYVPRECSVVGTKLLVDIRGRKHEAEIVPLPFYRRK